MTETEPTFTHKQVGILITLVTLLTSVSLFFYSGRIESGDSLRVFDAVSSLYHFNDLWQDESNWFDPAKVITPDIAYPLRPLDIDEPLVMYLSMPFYWLANTLPRLGNVHTVWLLNSILLGCTGGLLFGTTYLLGYGVRVATFATLLLGIGTIALTYSRTLFRDPIAMFVLMLALFFLTWWRKNGYLNGWRSAILGVLFIITIPLLLLTKRSTFLALPVLCIWALPDWRWLSSQKWWLRLMDTLLLVAIVTIPVLVFVDPIFNIFAEWIHPLLRRIDGGAFTAQTSLHSYLFSIGGSIWGTSPILLLAVPGLWMWYRQGKRRIVWSIVLLVIAYAAGHAFITREYWFGGLSWPPRFLVPVVPFLIIGLLPVLQHLFKKDRPIWLPPLFGSLLLYSLWIQFNAVAIEWSHYTTLLPEESGGAIEWQGGLNQINYLRWVIQPALWNQIGFDFIWTRANQPIWAISFAILILVCGVVLWLMLTNRLSSRRFSMISASLIPVLTVVTLLNLQAIYFKDPVYWSNKPALHEVLDTLEQEGTEDAVVLLPDLTYERFILNHNDLSHPRMIVLPRQPGESPSEEQPAEITSPHPVDLLTNPSLRIIDQIAGRQERIWVLAHNSPFIPWAVRPLERYLAQFYYPIQDVPLTNADPTVRLVEFSTYPAPNPYMFVQPHHSTDLQYDEAIQLLGFELPAGTVYEPGDIVPVSLYWQTKIALEQDMVIAWFIANETRIHQAQDSQPAFGFMPTSTWQANVPIWDNHATILPADIPPGDYEIWVVMYRFDAAGNIERLPIQGETVRDDNIGILPVTLTVEHSSNP